MAIVTNTTPTGVVLPYAGSSVPNGWMMCDGSAISRTEYAALFASIGTTYGAGDGSTTFNLPDYRYGFLRGYGAQISVTGSGTASATVTFTDATDLVTLNNHGLTNGCKVEFKTITTTTGISINTPYFVISATTNTFQLSSTLNGAALPLTNNGTGVFRDHAVFTNHGINRTGMRVRLSSGTLSGLGGSTDYYAIVINQNNLAFATTYANAIANTRIVISGANSGVIIQWEDPDITSRGLSSVGGSATIGSRQEDAVKPHNHSIYKGVTGDDTGTTIRGGTYDRNGGYGSTETSSEKETRPRNTYINYIIKV